MRSWLAAVAAVAIALGGCGQQPVAPETAPPAVVPGTAPPPVVQPAQPPPAPALPKGDAQSTERGRVSLYGKEFAGRKTANGEIFDPNALTMAHRTLPFGTLVRVTNVENHRSVEVRVNDRGPFVAGRIADLSLAAAQKLGMLADGVVDAILEVIKPERID